MRNEIAVNRYNIAMKRISMGSYRWVHVSMGSEDINGMDINGVSMGLYQLSMGSE